MEYMVSSVGDGEPPKIWKRWSMKRFAFLIGHWVTGMKDRSKGDKIRRRKKTSEEAAATGQERK